MNYDNAKKFKLVLSDVRFDVAVLDESHRVKNIKAAVTTAVLSQTSGITKNCDRVWAMTGTPVLNRPVELYPIMHHLFPCSIADCRGWYDFTIRFCGGRKGQWGWEANGATHIDDLSKRLKPHMLRRMLSDVQSQLPTATINPVYIEQSEAIRATLARERALYGKSESVADRAERLSVGEIVSIRRQVGMDKVAFAAGYLRDVLENGGKSLVFTYHRDVANALHQEFLRESVIYTGEQTITQKTAALTEFIEGDAQLFIAQIKAAGTGTDGLQRVCHRAVFIEQSYVPGEMDQAIGRLVRIGQDKTVSVDVLIHEDSIDEDIMKSLEKKREVIGKLIQRTDDSSELKDLNDQLAKLGVF
jgi:SWI/SNF-related matrix-associated actin-dependent regulator 1 of chromatin subfamily A